MISMSANDNPKNWNLQVTKASETCQRISVYAANLVVGQIQLFQSFQFHEGTFANPTQLIVG